jgi:hypothetical protein
MRETIMMRSTTLFLMAACVWLLGVRSLAQQSHHTVLLKDSSRVVGTIIELKPNESVTIRALDGTVHVVQWDRVEKIERKDEEIPPSTPSSRGDIESWYMYWALGYAFPSYPAALQADLDELQRRGDFTRTPLALEILGFYWPVAARTTLIGVIVSGASDRYDFEVGSAQITQILISGSVMHFFGEVPGDGVFVRGDAGLATLSQKVATTVTLEKRGIGFLLGAGYGIPVSEETRILLHGGYAYRRMQEESYDTFSISAGVLF